MTKVEYKGIVKDGWLHFPDQYFTLAEAKKFLEISPQKLSKLIDSDMLIWDQPRNSRTRYVELKSMDRLKHPENVPVFEPLTVQDARALQREVDIARHKIALAANLPPGAVKISFDLGV